MVDVHHHLLPGLDDGSPDLATSLEMAQIAVADGITHVVATPHASSRFTFDPDLVQDRAAELRAALAEAKIPLTLGLGADFHLSYENIQDALAHPSRYAINGHDYLLVELPEYTLSPSIKETFFELRQAGLTPILTHPERNPVLQREPERMLPWLRDGLLTQVTAASVTGDMGSKAQRLADKMLANRWVHVIATDAHGVKRRPPRMREARELINKRHGTLYADLLCRDNPMAIFRGQSLGEQEEGVYPSDPQPFKQRWYQRLFRA